MPESSSKFSGFFKLVCGLMAITCLIWAQYHSPFKELRSSYLATPFYGSWLSFSNIDSLAFHPWRIDLASSLLFDSQSYLTNAGLSLPIFIFTSWLLWSAYVRTSLALSFAAISSCFYLAFYGIDPVIFSTLAYLPLSILVLRLGASGKSASLSVVLSLLTGIILAGSANQLAYLVALLAILWVIYNHRGLNGRAGFFLSALILLLPPVYMLFITPLPNWPDYPQLIRQASLVTDLGDVNVIDREFLRLVFGRLLLWTALAGFIALLLKEKESNRDPELHYLWLAFLLIIVAGLDCLAPEQISQAAPLQGLARLVPGSFFIPLLPVFFALLIFLISTSVLKNSTRLGIFIWFATLSTLIFTGSRQSDSPPFLASDKAVRSELLSSAGCPSEDQLVSASIPVWKKLKTNLPCLKSGSFTKVELADMPATVSTSRPTNPKMNQRLMDGNLKTRWRTKEPAKQSDFIRIDFSSPITLYAITLRTGNFSEKALDNLNLTFSSDCKEPEAGISDTTSWTLAKSINHVPAVDITNNGFYFFSDKDSSILLSKPVTTSCFIINPASDSTSIWSVAEVGLVVGAVQ